MRINIEIDDKLIHDALKATGLKTKEEAIELGLTTLMKLSKQDGFKRFKDELMLLGSHDEMRSDP